MTDTPFLRVVGTAEALELVIPPYEESLTYQAKLLGNDGNSNSVFWDTPKHPLR